MGISRRLKRQQPGPPPPKSWMERFRALVDGLRDDRGYQIQGDDGRMLMGGAILLGWQWKELTASDSVWRPW